MYVHRTFISGEIYHLCNKSISNYRIFRNEHNIIRFLTAVHYYNSQNLDSIPPLSKALRRPIVLDSILQRNSQNPVCILAYCIMPDHYHLLIKVGDTVPLFKYINIVQDSYTRYYNKANNRKGPLWQSRFRSVYIPDQHTLLHVHRYIHLNPTTAGIVRTPEEYAWSSYRSFIYDPSVLSNTKEITISSIRSYQRFVEDNLDYQRKLKRIKKLLLE